MSKPNSLQATDVNDKQHYNFHKIFRSLFLLSYNNLNKQSS